MIEIFPTIMDIFDKDFKSLIAEIKIEYHE